MECAGTQHHPPPWMGRGKTVLNPRLCEASWPGLQSAAATGVRQQLPGERCRGTRRSPGIEVLLSSTGSQALHEVKVQMRPSSGHESFLSYLISTPLSHLPFS